MGKSMIHFVDLKDPSHKRASTDFCEPKLNLLAHAQCLEIGIGSQCGGHGICGGDRVRVQVLGGSETQSTLSATLSAPLSPPTEAELKHLSPKELAEGYRLACQCYPNEASLELKIDASITLGT
jgi:ferredoxin